MWGVLIRKGSLSEVITATALHRRGNDTESRTARNTLYILELADVRVACVNYGSILRIYAM